MLNLIIKIILNLRPSTSSVFNDLNRSCLWWSSDSSMFFHKSFLLKILQYNLYFIASKDSCIPVIDLEYDLLSG